MTNTDTRVDVDSLPGLGEEDPCQTTSVLAPSSPCGRPGVWVEAVCPNGHARRGPMCPYHQRQTRMWCRACFHAGAGLVPVTVLT